MIDLFFVISNRVDKIDPTKFGSWRELPELDDTEFVLISSGEANASNVDVFDHVIDYRGSERSNAASLASMSKDSGLYNRPSHSELPNTHDVRNFAIDQALHWKAEAFIVSDDDITLTDSHRLSLALSGKSELSGGIALALDGVPDLSRRDWIEVFLIQLAGHRKLGFGKSREFAALAWEFVEAREHDLVVRAGKATRISKNRGKILSENGGLMLLHPKACKNRFLAGYNEDVGWIERTSAERLGVWSGATHTPVEEKTILAASTIYLEEIGKLLCCGSVLSAQKIENSQTHIARILAYMKRRWESVIRTSKKLSGASEPMIVENVIVAAEYVLTRLHELRAKEIYDACFCGFHEHFLRQHMRRTVEA